MAQQQKNAFDNLMKTQYPPNNYYVYQQTSKSKQMNPSPSITNPQISPILFVVNFPQNYTAQQLYELFSQYGKILTREIIDKRNSGKKPYAFVQFQDMRDAAQAKLRLNNKLIEGRRLTIQFKGQKKTTNVNQFSNTNINNHKIPMHNEANNYKTYTNNSYSTNFQGSSRPFTSPNVVNSSIIPPQNNQDNQVTDPRIPPVIGAHNKQFSLKDYSKSNEIKQTKESNNKKQQNDVQKIISNILISPNKKKYYTIGQKHRIQQQEGQIQLGEEIKHDYQVNTTDKNKQKNGVIETQNNQNYLSGMQATEVQFKLRQKPTQLKYLKKQWGEKDDYASRNNRRRKRRSYSRQSSYSSSISSSRGSSSSSSQYSRGKRSRQKKHRRDKTEKRKHRKHQKKPSISPLNNHKVSPVPQQPQSKQKQKDKFTEVKPSNNLIIPQNQKQSQPQTKQDQYSQQNQPKNQPVQFQTFPNMYNPNFMNMLNHPNLNNNPVNTSNNNNMQLVTKSELNSLKLRIVDLQRNNIMLQNTMKQFQYCLKCMGFDPSKISYPDN